MANHLDESTTEPLVTKRQHRILVLMAMGYGYEQIAERTYLSSRTVVREVASVAKTLRAPSQVALGAIAYAKGVLRDEHLPNESDRE